jgi:hypothetical protein
MSVTPPHRGTVDESLDESLDEQIHIQLDYLCEDRSFCVQPCCGAVFISVASLPRSALYVDMGRKEKRQECLCR